MNTDDEYYISEGIEDEFLLSMADMAKTILDEKKRLDNIFKKHVGAYNTTLKERYSAKFLQAMSETHKPIFKIPSGIMSPRCANGSAKKITKEDVIKLNLPHRTPIKNQVSSSTERKQLFDEAVNGALESDYTVIKTSDESQLKVTSPNKNVTDQEETANKANAVKGEVGNLSPSFNSHVGMDSNYVTHDVYLQERFNLYGKPETITRLSSYEQGIEELGDKTSYEHQTTASSTEKKAPTSSNNTIDESKSGPFLKTVPSIFNTESNVKDSYNPNALTNESVIVDGKHETVPEFSIYDEHTKELLNKTPDKHQTMVASTKKQNGTHTNTADDTIKLIRERENCIFEEETENSSRHISKEQESFLSVKDTASNLSIDHQSIIRSSKTPEKFQVTHENTDKEKALVKPIILTVRSLSNDQKDIKTPHIPNMNKRKSPSNDHTEESSTTSFSSEDPECEVPLKMPKINAGITVNDKNADVSAVVNGYSLIRSDKILKNRQKIFNLDNVSSMDENSSLNPVLPSSNCSSMEDGSSFNAIVDSAVNGMNSFNAARESSMNGISSFKAAGDSSIEDISSANATGDSIMISTSSDNSVGKNGTNDVNSFNVFAENSTEDFSSFNVDGDSVTGANDFFYQSKNDIINNHEIFFLDDKSIRDDMSAIRINKHEILSFKPVEKIKETVFQTTVSQDGASCFTTIDDRKKTVDVISDNSNSKNYQIRISSAPPFETKDVESLTSLMQNLSPSVKRSFDGISKKTMVKKSGDSNETFARQLFLRDDLQKEATPTKKNTISEVSIPKSNNIYSPQKSKILEMLEIRKAHTSKYLPLFFEDHHDLKYIYEYIKGITTVVEYIPIKEFNGDLPETVTNILEVGSKLSHKVLSWKFGRETDLVVWNECLQKIQVIEDDIKNIEKEKKPNITLKHLQNWETSLKTLNKTVDEIILLREIRRPTVLQLGYEIENLIQLFIKYILLIGILKPSSRVSSG